MISYFPAVYPDELVYSWFCRYYVHSGHFSSKSVMQELYCKRSDNLSKEFIGNLNPETREQIGKIYPLDRLVLEHTMYPQYARFIPLEDKKTSLYCLEKESCDVHHLFSVLPRNDGEQYLRFCPLCVIEDRGTYGEAYWHRKHQIRNMRLCSKHRCRLMESNVPAKSEQSYTFYPAEIYTYQSEVVFENNSAAIRFANFLETIFDAPIDFANDIPISSILYDGMSRTKYLKPSGRSRYTKILADDITEFYKNMGIYNISSMSQIQKTLLGLRFDFSVVCQIAFFLGMNPKELISPALTPEQIQKEQKSHYMKGSVPIDWELLDAETAAILEETVKGIYYGTANENGRPERISERLVYRKMGLLGQQLENMPKCKAIFEQYTESYPESWARKIIWAYQRLKQKDKQFYWSDIRELSGVKKKNFQLVIPYLLKYTDISTMNQIINLVWADI